MYGPGGEEYSWNEPTKSSREDPTVKDIPKHVLERTMFRINGGDVGPQSDGTRPPWRHIRRNFYYGLVLNHVDEVINELLTKYYSCDDALPRNKKRWNVETVGALEPRKSVLEDDFEEEEEKEENDQLDDGLEDGLMKSSACLS